MSKITQIERELLSINDSIFHRLCSEYIHYKYNFNVTDKGLTKGQDKPSKGTPDSYILENGKTLFVEITTQKKGIYKKFNDDINKCLDTTKTGVSLGDIEKIFLCYNSRMDVSDKNDLLDLGIKNNIQIEIITLDELKYDLHRPYGFIANDFLGIGIDSGQILDLERFIYENDRKTTTLKNPFISRDSELNKIIEIIEQNKIAVLSGNPGTGKTRLAIEAAKKIKEKKTELKLFVITNKGQSIYNDLQSYFLPKNEYVVIIDDANRIGDLNRILELSILDDLSIQLIITVRDYALRKVLNSFEDFSKIRFQSVKIEKLTGKQIEHILSSIKISSPLCVNRITQISNGNPRLAMMAAVFALETNNCNVLNNVTSIYDQYFSKSINEIEELKDSNLLRSLGIISFNRSFNKENTKFNNTTFEAFKISENEFWENAFKLHDLELVDLFEKQIVKISDQIIAEYFFYYIFIKEKIIDFSVILNIYLENFSGKIRDNLYPILSNFDQFKIMEELKESVNKFYESVKHNDDLVFKFFEIFWFDRKTELLVWLQERIDLIEPKSILEFNFNEPKDTFGIEKYPYLELLKLFGYHPDENFYISLELLFSYIFKEPIILPNVVKYTKSDLIFKTQSYNQDYFIQVRLFDFLFEKANTDVNSDFYKQFILSIIEKYLHIFFEDTKTSVRDRNTFVISQVYLFPTEEIKELRKRLWEFLLVEYNSYQDKIFEILSSYINQTTTSIFQHAERNEKDTPAKQIAKFDKDFLIMFFEEKLTGENYLHCILFDSFLRRFEENELDYVNLKQKFTNRVYLISMILKWDFLDLKKNYEIELIDELKELKKREIRSFFVDYKFEDYIQLFEDISFLLKIDSFHSLGFQNSLEVVFLQLAELNIDLLFRLLEHLMSNNNPLSFNSYQVINALIGNSKNDAVTIYKFISKYEYNLKSIWLQHFFSCLEIKSINKYFYSELIITYKNWGSNLHVSFDFWNNYKAFDKNIFVTIFEILIGKTKKLDFVFDFHYWSLFEKYISEFNSNIKLLEEIYLFKARTDFQHFDYGNNYLKQIVKIDNEFLFVFLEEKYSDIDYLSARHKNHLFDFIWDFKNYDYILKRSIDYFIDKPSFSNDIINIFFPVNLNNKVNDFITKFIIKYANDEKRIRKIFNVITYSYTAYRLKFISILLDNTNDLELIKSIGFVKGFKSGGSLIPLFEADRKFWKEFEDLLSKNVRFLKLKLWTKQKQIECLKTIEEYRKRDFVDDF